jgi:hypothetical protein
MDEQKEPQVDSIASQAPVEPIPDIDIPTLRTYKSDINQTINRDKISTAKVLIAEQNRQRKTQEKFSDTSIKRPTNILVLLLSIILIVAALGGIGYFGYTKVIVKSFDPVTVPISFLFIFDQEKFIDSEKDPSEVYQSVESNMQSISQSKDGTYTDFIFYKTNPETNDKTRITSAEFFKLYDISLPTNIARSIAKEFVYGAYKTEGKTEPFLVLGISEYETMYSTMFVWEETLALDIKDLFPVLKDLFDLTKKRPITEVALQATSTATTIQKTSTSTIKATSTATTTSQIPLSPEQEFQKQIEDQRVINRNISFIDTVFSNKDVRAVRDQNGTPFFYYSFIDKTKILFAQDPKVLSEISRKIKEKSLVR